MTQKSSIKAPTLGKISLTSSPLWPYFLKVKGDAIRLPVALSVLTLGPGSGLPSWRVSSGLGSKVSTWERAAIEEEENDVLDLGREVRGLQGEGTALSGGRGHAGKAHCAETAAGHLK
jgi:hypothetical protein